jgi:leader peptidase (prepilin peptidase)/N-methyltransferase
MSQGDGGFMHSGLLWWSLAIALGMLCGALVAQASVRLPAATGEGASMTRGRYVLCFAACTGMALWSAAWSPGPLALVGTVLAAQLVLIAIIDAEHFWLPHRLTVPLGLMGLAEALAFEPETIAARLIGAAAGFAVLAGIAFAYRRLRGREGLGGGDFRLLAAAGAWVGWIGLPSVLVWACVCGLVIAGAKAVKGRVSLSDQVPFGLYLAVGLWLTWLYGPIGRAG